MINAVIIFVNANIGNCFKGRALHAFHDECCCWTLDSIGHQWTAVQTMEWRELFLQLTPIGCSQLAAARLIFLPICSAKVGQSDADETSDLTSGQMEKLAKPHTKFPNNPVILF